MESRNSSVTGSGIGFLGILTIVFIVLKLCGVIEWSWLLVLSPLLIELAIVVLFFIVALVTFYREERYWKRVMKNMNKDERR